MSMRLNTAQRCAIDQTWRRRGFCEEDECIDEECYDECIRSFS
jgi:hypothetical protein